MELTKMLDYKKFKIKINALTPIHIGNGDVYSQLDYVFDKTNKKVFVIDFNRIIANSSPSAINDLTSEIKKNFGNNRWRGDVAEFFRRYKLDWEDFVIKEIPCENIGNNEIHQFVNSSGRCYIPGSSIKGAIRTCFLWDKIKNDESLKSRVTGIIKEFRNKKPEREHADDEICKLVFGQTAHADIFKNLVINDSTFYQDNQIAVIHAQSYNFKQAQKNPNKGGKVVDQFIEVVKKDNFMESEMTIFKNEEFDIEEIIVSINNFSKELVGKEIELCAYNENFTKIKQIKSFIENNKNSNSCFIKLGKGTGFLGMTLCSLLDKDTFHNYIRTLFRIGESRAKPREYSPIFPLTHLIQVDTNKVPLLPFGWIKLTFDKE